MDYVFTSRLMYGLNHKRSCVKKKSVGARTAAKERGELCIMR